MTAAEQLSFFDKGERWARHRAKNRAKRIAQAREWRSRNRQRVLAYRQENREARKAYDREWARNNPEKNTAKCARWRKRHAEHMRAVYRIKSQIRRAVEPMDAAAREYVDILLVDPCSYCGAPTQTVDHIVPLSRGGTNAWDNLTAACTSCNSGKNATPLLLSMLRGGLA